jgi:hypothetical protein
MNCFIVGWSTSLDDCIYRVVATREEADSHAERLKSYLNGDSDCDEVRAGVYGTLDKYQRDACEAVAVYVATVADGKVTSHDTLELNEDA